MNADGPSYFVIMTCALKQTKGVEFTEEWNFDIWKPIIIGTRIRIKDELYY